MNGCSWISAIFYFRLSRYSAKQLQDAGASMTTFLSNSTRPVTGISWNNRREYWWDITGNAVSKQRTLWLHGVVQLRNQSTCLPLKLATRPIDLSHCDRTGNIARGQTLHDARNQMQNDRRMKFHCSNVLFRSVQRYNWRNKQPLTSFSGRPTSFQFSFSRGFSESIR
jgi:hypothetical protein